MSKQVLTVEDIESQVALELPQRELMALLVVLIGNVDVVDNVTITITNVDVNVLNIFGNQICAFVLSLGRNLTCTWSINL